MSSLCLAVLAGWGADLLLGRQKKVLPTCTIFALLMAWSLFENLPAPYPVSAPNVPPFYSKLREGDDHGALLEVPIPDDPSVYPRRMLYQTVHQKPTYGGYLARGIPSLPFSALPGFAQFKSLSPSAPTDIVFYSDHDLLVVSRCVLGAYQGGCVAIEKSLLSSQDLARVRRVSESIFDQATPIFEDESSLAYSIPPCEKPPQPILCLGEGWYGLEQTQGGSSNTNSFHWRWMPDEAWLRLISPKHSQVRLKLRAGSFRKSRRLGVSVDGTCVSTLEITEGAAADYETSAFEVSPGSHSVRLQSIDGSDVPGDDRRALSFCVSEIGLSP